MTAKTKIARALEQVKVTLANIDHDNPMTKIESDVMKLKKILEEQEDEEMPEVIVSEAVR
jgi:hypothetical protein